MKMLGRTVLVFGILAGCTIVAVVLAISIVELMDALLE